MPSPGFWRRVWIGVRVGLKVAAAFNGRSVGSHKIQINELPVVISVTDAIDGVIFPPSDGPSATGQ